MRNPKNAGHFGIVGKSSGYWNRRNGTDDGQVHTNTDIRYTYTDVAKNDGLKVPSFFMGFLGVPWGRTKRYAVGSIMGLSKNSITPIFMMNHHFPTLKRR